LEQPRSAAECLSVRDDRNYRVLSAKLLATVLHLHRGTPYVYQGDEIGMTNAPFASIDDFDDIESRNHYTAAVAAGEDPETVLEAMRHMSRDNARTPMQWNDSPNAGFTTGTPWLPVNPNYRQINVAEAVDDPNSIFHYFRQGHRLAARRSGGGLWRFHNAAARRRTGLCLHPGPGRSVTPRRSQFLRHDRAG
jgi:oligo-1,6-glucosidase